MGESIRRMAEDITELKNELNELKSKINEEFELSAWAKKELELARKEKTVSHESVMKEFGL